MGAIERVIQMGKMMEGGKADLNTLMDAAPGTFAEIQKENKDRQERAEIRADDNEKWEKNYTLQTNQIDYGKDSQTNSILAGMTAQEAQAAFPHFTYYTEQGKADAQAILTGKNTTHSNKEGWLNSITQSSQDFQNPNMTLEEKEVRLNEIRKTANLNNYDLKNNESYNNLQKGYVQQKTEKSLNNSMSGLVKDDVNVGNLVKIISDPNVSDAVKKQWLDNSIKKDLTSNDIIAFTKVLEVSKATTELGTDGNPYLADWATKQLLERGGYDMKDYVNPAQANIPEGYTDTGKKTSDGHMIVEDSFGKQMVLH